MVISFLYLSLRKLTIWFLVSMYLKKTYPVNQLRDYSSLFMRSEISRILKDDLSSINLKIDRYDKNLFNRKITYLKYYKHLYKVLGKYYPNEYFYKNEFINKWLKKELGSSNSVIFSEFRIGKAIADLTMFNGTSKVFEIKTELDKEYRLSGQISAYKKIFNEIYLIVPGICLKKYENYDKNIGIISFDSDYKNFQLIRKSEKSIGPDSSTIMEVLYTHEYKEIVKQYYGSLPKMTDFTQFEICSRYISQIPIDSLNVLFINTVKKRSVHNLFFNKINSELNQICLSLNLNKSEKEKLINNLNTQIFS